MILLQKIASVEELLPVTHKSRQTLEASLCLR